MRQRLQIIDGIFNNSSSQKRTKQVREISDSGKKSSLLPELLLADIINRKRYPNVNEGNRKSI